MKAKYMITVEMVGKGHPDKVADQISDAVIYHCLKSDPSSRCAVETLLKDDTVVLAGELTTSAKLDGDDLSKIVDDVFKEVKYLYKPKIINLLNKQSADIAQGVDTGGAGDQGMMFGYATSETSNMMPYAYNIAKELMVNVDALNDHKEVLGDGKCQITLDDNNKICQLVVSKQNSNEKVLKELVNNMLKKAVVDFGKGSTTFEEQMTKDCKVYINPTGKFEIGGPFGDCGLTGRKIIVDTYGGIAHHGGGAFSGKDLTKVDRSGAYYARELAKKVINEGLAKEVEIRLAFIIGVAEVADITCTYCDNGEYDKINEFLRKKKFTVKDMISTFSVEDVNPKRCIYGHFK